MSYALGRDVGAMLLVRTVLGTALGAQATRDGVTFDLLSLGNQRPASLKAVVALHANLDASDSATIDQIKLQSSAASNFSSPVDRATAPNLVLTEPSGTDISSYGYAEIDYDLTQLPESHRYIRLSIRGALSDTVNTNGQVVGVFVFGGLQEIY